ncbi:MAG: aconitase X [Nitrososphaeria archaeon]
MGGGTPGGRDIFIFHRACCSGVYLSEEDERALSGERGGPVAAAYRVLVAVGEFLGAKRLIPISSAHLSGVNYANMGEEGLEFLERFSASAKVSVHTTVNPCGADLYDPPSYVPRDFLERQRRIREAYLRMGCVESFTCAPYELENAPPPGSHVSWAESSAAIFANSELGLYTNRESGLSALAAAVAGKTPEGGMHLEENRVPGYALRVDPSAVADYLDYQLAAYYAASRTSSDVIAFIGPSRPSRPVIKLMSAAIGAAGPSSMFVFSDSAPRDAEVEVLSAEDLARLRREMVGSGPIDPSESIGILGCPFYGRDELERVAAELAGWRHSPRLFIQTSRAIESSVGSLADSIRGSGATLLRCACYPLAPVDAWMGASRIYADSIKAVHYLRKRGVDAYLRDRAEILRSFARGPARRSLDGHGLGQVPGAIYLRPPGERQVVREEL